MGIVYNPFTSNFDFTGSAGATQWMPPVATEALLPTVGNTDGDARVTLDTKFVWVYDGTSSRWVNQGFKQTTVGTTPNSQGYSALATNISTNRTERQLQLQPADATNPGIISILAQAIAGDKTFQDKILADGSIDVTVTAGTDVLNIGTANADVINLGRTGATINVIGSTMNQNVTNLNVTDKLFTVNKGGALASGTNAGFEIEENSVITGYVKTDGTRSGFVLKAPASAEIQLNPDTTYDIALSSAILSASRTYTFPDISGTVVLTQGNQVIAGVKTFSGTINISSLGSPAPLKLDALNNVISGLIVNADVSASAAIVYSKLALTNSIVNADIASAAAIAYSKLALIGSIVNADISASAAIVYSKLSLSNSIVNADIASAAAIAYSKLSLSNSIVNADIATTAAIAYSKLSLTSSIIDADVATAAAIARTKFASGTANRLVVNDGTGVMSDAAAITAARALISDTNGIPTQSIVTSTELGYVSGVTSSIQTQLGTKLANTLNSANIFVGNISNVATGVAVTGDIAIDNTGLTIIQTNAVSAAKFRQSAALSVVGNAMNTTANVADITASVDGQVLLRSGTTLAFALITNANISASAAIDYNKLSLIGSVVNADISASAAIAYSKLTLTNSIVNADIAAAAAIVYSKLTLSNSIVNADISSSAAIAYSKLSLATSIVNGDIATAAAIARTKLASGTANHVLINDGTGVMSSEATLAISRGGTGLGTTPTNGQLLIGNGANYTLATITAGAGISITNGAGTITIAAASATFGTRASPVSITAGTGIISGASAMSTTATEQFLYLQGNGGAVTILASPAIEAHTITGARMTIFGRSDTNTLVIPRQTGLVELNGDCLLGASDSLTLVFDGTAWVEVCRS